MAFGLGLLASTSVGWAQAQSPSDAEATARPTSVPGPVRPPSPALASSLDSAPPPPASGAAGSSTKVAGQLAPSREGRSALPWVLFCLGGAGFIVGATAGVLAMDKHSSLSEVCPGTYCPPSTRDDLDSYHGLSTLSTAGFVVGGAAIVAGVVLFLTSPKGDRALTHVTRWPSRAEPATVGLGSMLSPGTLGILGHF